MATVRDRRISISVGSQTIDGVIIHAGNSVVEVGITSPAWCNGILAHRNVTTKKLSRQDLIDLGKQALKDAYLSCGIIKEHTAEIKAIEEEYNIKYDRLNKRCEDLQRAIHLVKEYIDKDAIDNCDGQTILLPLRREKNRLLAEGNALIRRYTEDFLNLQIDIYGLVNAINRICETSLRCYRGNE